MSYEAPELTSVGNLDAGHIDSMIMFRAEPAPGVVSYVIGELRQIYHVGGTTNLNYGELAACENSFSPEDRIILNPDLECVSDHVSYLEGPK